jgi:hypothetical protein
MPSELVSEGVVVWGGGDLLTLVSVLRKYNLKVLRFSERWLSCRVVYTKSSDISEEHVDFVFRVEE